jgi:hypothetical protein
VDFFSDITMVATSIGAIIVFKPVELRRFITWLISISTLLIFGANVAHAVFLIKGTALLEGVLERFTASIQVSKHKWFGAPQTNK